jgi:hypothetical protein
VRVLPEARHTGAQLSLDRAQAPKLQSLGIPQTTVLQRCGPLVSTAKDQPVADSPATEFLDVVIAQFAMEPNAATLSSQPSCHLSSGSAGRLHLCRPKQNLDFPLRLGGSAHTFFGGTVVSQPDTTFLSRANSPPRLLHFCFLNVQEFLLVALFRPNLAVALWLRGILLRSFRCKQIGVSALHDACHSQKRSLVLLGRTPGGVCPRMNLSSAISFFAGRSICRCGLSKDRGGGFRRRAFRRGICGCRIWGLILFGRGRGVHGSLVGPAYS